MKPTGTASDSGGAPQEQSNQQQGRYHQARPTGPRTQAAPQDMPQSTFGPTAGRYTQPHFQQPFGFDADTFPRSRFRNNPFVDFGDHDADFDFPEMARFNRPPRASASSQSMSMDPSRIPAEFRHYIPEGFGESHRGVGGGVGANTPPLGRHSFYTTPQPQPYFYGHPTNIPANGDDYHHMRNFRDAAIQTEEPPNKTNNNDNNAMPGSGGGGEHGGRAQSAPPNDEFKQQRQSAADGQRPSPTYNVYGKPQGAHFQQQQQQYQQPFHKAPYASPPQQQQTPQAPQTPGGGSYVRSIPIFVEGRSEPIINSHKEIPNQNAPPAAGPASGNVRGRKTTPPDWQNLYHHHPQQSQAAAPPPEYGDYIPYAHESPSQYQSKPWNGPNRSSQPASNFQSQQQPEPPQQQQQQQEPPQSMNASDPTSRRNASESSSETQQTMDSIQRIQSIQRDVLDLMTQVENFRGSRQDKTYVYLDEMLTRNLLKLDNVDTNGQEAIRQARKEAVKCIQASINALETIAGGYSQTAQEQQETKEQLAADEAEAKAEAEAEAPIEALQASMQGLDVTAADSKAEEPEPEPEPDHQQEATNKSAAQVQDIVVEPLDATQITKPIPLPPPEGMCPAPDENSKDDNEDNKNGGNDGDHNESNKVDKKTSSSPSARKLNKRRNSAKVVSSANHLERKE